MNRRLGEELERQGGQAESYIMNKDKPMLARMFNDFMSRLKMGSASDTLATDAFKHYFYSWCFSVGMPTSLAIEVWQEEIFRHGSE